MSLQAPLEMASDGAETMLAGRSCCKLFYVINFNNYTGYIDKYDSLLQLNNIT